MKRLLLLLLALSMIVSLGGIGAGDLSNGQSVSYGLRKHLLKFGASSNWSGYAVETDINTPQSSAVSDVAGQWVVPDVMCTRMTTYSAIWVGIDGYSNNTVEQIGTGQDCQRGREKYYAWYEMYPYAMHKTSLAVNPGDTILASVKYSGNNDNYELTLNDTTSGKNFSSMQRLAGAARQSAEWVVEAPSSFFGVLPLTNFGTVNFSNAGATINGQAGSISDTDWQNDEITMQSGKTVKALSSDLLAGGTSFSDTWYHN